MIIRFYHCNTCGKLVAVLSDTNIPTDCCGRAMEELIPDRTYCNTDKEADNYEK